MLGAVQDLGPGWFCGLDPHLPMGEGLLWAGWKRWLAQVPSVPGKAH